MPTPHAPDWHAIEQPVGPPLVPTASPADIDEHRKRAYLSFEQFLRSRLEILNEKRDAQWQRDYSSVEAYLHSVAQMRQRLKAMLGFWQEPSERQPMRVLDRKQLLDQPDFVAQRVRFQVLPGLETYAIELAPKTNPSKPCPGLLVQHGYCGTPELVCGFTPGANASDYAYRSLGIRAVRRGYYVVAVHHPAGYGSHDETITKPLDRFEKQPNGYGQNRLNRMATLCGGTLFGLYMMASSRGVDLLLGSNRVDLKRVGMYGLSQGGQSALYLPALDTRIKASVAGAYFNHRFKKLLGPCKVTNYLEWQDECQFFQHVLRWFSDSDLASLICPRALAIEAGMKDTSVDLEDAKDEFERARVHFGKLGASRNIELIVHPQGHISATKRAFDFLAEHLR